MTTPSPAAWCTELGAALAEAAHRAGLLAAQVAADWPDAHGVDRSERLVLVARALAREAETAAAIGVAAARAAEQEPASTHPAGTEVATAVLRAVAGLGSAASRRTGARLGAMVGDRTDDAQGMQLPDTTGDH